MATEDYEHLSYKVEQFLRKNGALNQDAAKSTIDISKAVFEEGATRKKINPTLYKMQKDKRVEKVAEDDGTKPRWFLTPFD